MASSKPEKAMSSRLLTMKFMQRAAAAGVHTSPSTPSSQRDDSDSSIPPAKRRQSGQNSRTSSDQKAVSAALQAEEDKRQAGLARQAAEAGETNWVLEFPGDNSTVGRGREQGPVVVPMVSEDAVSEWGQGAPQQEEQEEFDGRRGYGGFKRKKKATEPRVSLGTSNSNVNEDAMPTSISGAQQRPEGNTPRRGDDQSDLNNMIRDQKYRADRDDARKRKLAAQQGYNKPRGGGKPKGISSGGGGGGGGISKPPRGPRGSKGKNRR